VLAGAVKMQNSCHTAREFKERFFSKMPVSAAVYLFAMASLGQERNSSIFVISPMRPRKVLLVLLSCPVLSESLANV